MSRLRYELLHQDPHTQARAGKVITPHGEIETPIFMPVGTLGSVKCMKPRELHEIGAQIILGNTYHLYLRPGHQLIEKMGGLHNFIGWEKPILTDSGGFQVFSQEGLRKITEKGVEFRSHLDGSKHFIGPEESMAIQMSLGADIAMAFDECAALPATKERIKDAMDRTTRWLARCVEAHNKPEQALFGIIQGGIELDLRQQHLEELLPFDLPGYAIGGLSVGEAPADMYRVVADLAPRMPADKPRYLMGVGTPEDLVNCVESGVDMFDCVMPTRHARNAQLFTSLGRIKMRNAQYIDDEGPLDPHCSCYTCQTFSRSYLRHLYNSKEMLGPILGTLHNLHYYLAIMSQMREAIKEGRFLEWKQHFYALREGAEGEA